ncbi:MAG: hypothetical protein KF763_00900 [Cyclobacteriaceae bacterium]|nr:hypothetical protein [Cyclobacteriaceae bacterium]
METNKQLMTVKAASIKTGASISFLKKLLQEGRLKRYRINSAVYLSLTEFEKIAQPAEA